MSILSSKTTQTATSLGFRGLFKLLKFGSLFIIFGIVFAKAAIQSYQEKSFEPIIKEIGGKIALATKDLLEQSQLIIDKGNIYVDSLWSVVTTYAGLIFAVIAVISWIRVFAWIWARSPYSFSGNTFENTTIGTMCFVGFQTIFILAIDSFAGNITGWSDVGEAIATPFLAFILLFKAIIILINPISSQLDKYTNITA